jgi:hypothetical protein
MVMELVDKIVDLIALIPGTFWGVVIGSLFSISGVMLTNSATNKRLRQQFSHDLQLRIGEREHALRRDVYLAATEAIATSLASLGRFTDLNIPNDELTKTITEKMPVVAKVQVIGGSNIVKGIVEVAGELSALTQILIIRRIPLSLVKSEIDTLGVVIARSSSERDKLLELMKSYNLSGETDVRKWDVIKGSFQYEEKVAADALEKQKRLHNGLLGKQLVYTKECIQGIHKIGRLLTPTLLAVREELNLPLDAPSYTKMIDVAQSTQIEILERTLREVQEYVTAWNEYALSIPPM